MFRAWARYKDSDDESESPDLRQQPSPEDDSATDEELDFGFKRTHDDGEFGVEFWKTHLPPKQIKVCVSRTLVSCARFSAANKIAYFLQLEPADIKPNIKANATPQPSPVPPTRTTKLPPQPSKSPAAVDPDLDRLFDGLNPDDGFCL